MGVFMLGIVIAAVIGGPLSGGLLELDGVLGLEGWQWLFLGQGLPAVAVGAWVLRALPSSPAEAAWLGHEERVALERELAAESAARERRASFTLRGALTDRRILHCAAVYFTINFASYGAIFWFADILERIGDVEGIELGLLAAVPMALGSAGLVVIGRRSDRSGDRRRWVVIGMLLGAAGLGATALLPAEACVLTLGVCAFGLLGAVPAFWAMPTSLLNGRPAAGGVALINTIGVTGGIFGPVVVGVAKDAGSLEAGLGALALVLLGGTALRGAAALRGTRARPRAAHRGLLAAGSRTRLAPLRSTRGHQLRVARRVRQRGGQSPARRGVPDRGVRRGRVELAGAHLGAQPRLGHRA